MTSLAALLDAQSTRFALLDEQLPPVVEPPQGLPISAALPDGERVGAVITETRLSPGQPGTLWSAMHTWELHPVLGDRVADGLPALLSRWRTLLDRADPSADSSCMLSWPSRDAQAACVLLQHGFLPLSVIAVCRHPDERGPGARPGIRVRRARLSDVDSAVRIAMAELTYSALVGSTVLRPDAEEIKRTSLAGRIAAGDPVWIAEQHGIPVGMVDCWTSDSSPGTWTATRLPPGHWGYVNSLSVLPEARGLGVGQRLMAAAHRELRRLGVTGVYLYYNPPNPLSSVFWPRQGYRPLWTVWEARPADRLR